MNFPVKNSNSCRNATFTNNDFFHCPGCFYILRVWHTYF